MLNLDDSTKEVLIDIFNKKNVCLEGNILKLIDVENEKNEEFIKYVKTCIERDKNNRQKRLEVTKQVQKQNVELEKNKKSIEKINKNLKISLKETEDAKSIVENDLDILQKKTQFELIGTIVKVALYIIVGVGILTTIMYALSLYFNKDTQMIGSAWSNMFGILLTNAFSIVGTIMGVKYATGEKK
jgi:Fe2+ transport system protein B